MVAVHRIDSTAPAAYHQLKKFLCERYWLPDTDYPLCVDIFHALGLTGDDCHEFMTDFSNLFSIDLTDYIWPNYHLAEDEAQDVRAALRPLMRMAGLKTQPLNRDLIPISIDHLLLVIEQRRWFDPLPAEREKSESSLSRSLARFSARLRAGGVPRTQRR